MTKNLSEEMQRNARQALAGLTPYSQGEEAGGLSARRLIAAFFRARYLVFGTTLFGVLIGVFMAITASNNYVSTGQFLLTSSGAESRSLDPTQSKETSQETIATGAAYILNSDDLLMRVVDELTPQRILQPYQPTGEGYGSVKGLFFKIQRDWNAVDESNMVPEEALKRLQKTISVSRPQFTDVLIATCNANNPELAKEILATYMVKAVEWHIEKYDDKKAYEGAKDANEKSLEDYSAAHDAMREFLDRRVLVNNFDEHKQAVTVADIENVTRLKALKDDLTFKSEKKKRFDALLLDEEKLPRTVKRRVRQSIATELATVLRSQLADASIKLSELKRQFRDPNHPEIESQKRRIADIKSSLENRTLADDKPTWSEEVIDNQQYLDAVKDHDQLVRDLWGLEALVTQAGTRRQETAEELKRLALLEPKYEALRSTLLRCEVVKKAAAINWEFAQNKKALGLGNFSSLKNVQAASLPLEKEGPNRGKLLIGGLFVGLFLGLGLVVLRALPDRIVRTRDDLEDIEGLAVIGVMPRLDRTNLRRHTAMREQGW